MCICICSYTIVGICSFLKLCRKTPETSRKTCKDLLVFLFWRWPEKVLNTFFRTLASVSLVLGLGHFCPWPREDLSSEGLSLALASDFVCVLGLGPEPCVLDFTSASYAYASVHFGFALL